MQADPATLGLPPRDHPGRLMGRLALVWLAMGIVAGVPMIYSWYLQNGMECPSKASPLAYVEGLPASQPQLRAGGIYFMQPGKTGVAKTDCRPMAPPTPPQPVAGVQAALTSIPAVPSVAASSTGWPSTGGQPGTGTVAAKLGWPAVANLQGTSVPPLLGIFHPSSLPSASTAEIPGEMDQSFIGGINVLGTAQSDTLTPPVMPTEASATPASIAVALLGGQTSPASSIGSTGINYIDQVTGAIASPAVGPDGMPLTGIDYIDQLMAGGATAFSGQPGSGIPGLPGSGVGGGPGSASPFGGPGSTSPFGGPANLSNGSQLNNTAQTTAQPTTNLGLSTNKNGQLAGAASSQP